MPISFQRFLCYLYIFCGEVCTKYTSHYSKIYFSPKCIAWEHWSDLLESVENWVTLSNIVWNFVNTLKAEMDRCIIKNEVYRMRITNGQFNLTKMIVLRPKSFIFSSLAADFRFLFLQGQNIRLSETMCSLLRHFPSLSADFLNHKSF